MRLKDFEDIPNFDRTLIDKNSQPRMPWRDIAVQLRGLVTKDLSRHFIQYWNFAKYDIEGKGRGRRNILKKKNFGEAVNSNVISRL